MYDEKFKYLRVGTSVTFYDLAKLVFIIYLFWSALYAPLKWITFSVGADYIFYLPKLTLAIVLFLGLIFTSKLSRVFTIFSLFIIISCLYGFYNFGSMEQVLLGLYILLPLLYGLYFGRSLIDGNFRRIAFFLWSIIIFGVLLNKFVEFPWAGMNVSVGDKEVYVGKAWQTYGVARLSGFSAASYSVATQLLPLSIYLLSFYRRFTVSMVLIITLTLISLILTTAKGAIFAFFFVIILITLYRGKNKFISPLLLLLIIVNILMPLSSTYLFSGLSYQGNSNGGSWMFTSETIYERLLWMWPQSWAFILEKGSIILGDGIGGIGTPIAYYYDSSIIFAATDSLFIYSYGMFGIFSVLFYFKLWWRTKKIDWDCTKSIFCTLMVFSLFLYGIVGAPFEREFWMVFLGITMKLIFERGYDKTEDRDI